MPVILCLFPLSTVGRLALMIADKSVHYLTRNDTFSWAVLFLGSTGSNCSSQADIRIRALSAVYGGALQWHKFFKKWKAKKKTKQNKTKQKVQCSSLRYLCYYATGALRSTSLCKFYFVWWALIYLLGPCKWYFKGSPVSSCWPCWLLNPPLL